LFRFLYRYVPIGCITASSLRRSGTSYVFRDVLDLMTHDLLLM